MNWMHDLITNQFLLTSLSSWFFAQISKVFINAWIQKKIVWERLVGDGGMPSGHSATVTSLAVITALEYGTGSFQFAFSAVLAIVVCHDAMGVRQETGKQAVIINEIVKLFGILSEEALPEVKLKELVGHTPMQVIAGALLGLGNAFLMYYAIL
jgi:acid phosphatase family membrane protein YuiD